MAADEALFQPTAVQFPVAGQETLSSAPRCLVVCADQARPFQCSARVIPVSRWPTAVQSLAHRHEMPNGWPPVAGLLSGWMVQAWPFQPSPSSREKLLL